MHYGRHFVTTEWDKRLPLHLCSVGYDEHQVNIHREEGFPTFHWIHTIKGAGEFAVNGHTVRMQPNQGILLKPGVPHSYRAETPVWSIWYLTFDGALANPITSSLELQHMELISWPTDCELARIHEYFADKCRNSYDVAGVNGSQEVFAFLTQLKRFGQTSGQPSLSKGHERLAPIYALIEERYGDPDLGLPRLADTLGVSSQYLNTLFRNSWGMSPYQYLVQFRIQKSKELLIADRGRTVKAIAGDVGFQDDSHFVHTFRKLVGMTPVQFRLQYGE